MFISTNLKVLRKRRGLTQDDLAVALGTKRPTLNNYENQLAVPPVEMLIRISDFFGITIDALVKVNLGQLTGFQLSELENGQDQFINGSKLRVLTTTVGNDNTENIELVPEKAKAGYLAGYSDPGYIGSLPVFRLPFLDKDKKYRAFQVSGDSMLPIPPGAYITGEFVRDWYSIKSGQACVILTMEDGLSFKIIENHLKEKGIIRCISLNQLYTPYDINALDIREIWKFVNFISPGLPPGSMELNQVAFMLGDLKNEIREIRSIVEK